jgi:hypothetical protein
MKNEDHIHKSEASITDIGEQYLRTKIELLRIRAIENISGIAGSMVFMFLLILFSLISFGFVSLAVGFFIADLLNNVVLGFGMVAIVYLVTALIVAFIARGYIRERIMDWLIKEISEYE